VDNKHNLVVATHHKSDLNVWNIALEAKENLGLDTLLFFGG
jgi:hypothetical protein